MLQTLEKWESKAGKIGKVHTTPKDNIASCKDQWLSCLTGVPLPTLFNFIPSMDI